VTLLLDTHVILWWQRDDRRLSRAARRAIATADIVWVSAVSGWEVAIKSGLGRLRLDEPFPALLGADDFTELPMTMAHAARLQQLARTTAIRSTVCSSPGPRRARHDSQSRSRAGPVRRANAVDVITRSEQSDGR
jgi:hypothetical protein